ncbi:MAG: glycoside hydrolase [Actinomycetota bacterium]|nr:glycoside hydrolase [Actinomycetota bacterium]
MPRRLWVLPISVLCLLVVSQGSPAAGIPSTMAFRAYHAPHEFPNAHTAGETSIGTVKGTTDALMQLRYTTARVRFNDKAHPATASWSDVTFVGHHFAYDPILWSDRVTGRTFVSLLLSAAGASTVFTDDGGVSWTPTVSPVTLPGLDHQVIGSGPRAGPLPQVASAYEHDTYYCVAVITAQCSRSDDGGRTWEPPVVLPAGTCEGTNGRAVVSLKGAVFVPRENCGSLQGMHVSHDGGTTWSAVTVPGTTPTPWAGLAPGPIRLPAVAFDASNRMYFATTSGGRPVVLTSQDEGVHWSKPVDVGTRFAIRNTEFPMVVADDAGRAAFAFYGTPKGGDDQALSFSGVWHLYVAYTFNGGATWQAVDTTPTDPVQRGCIAFGGGHPRAPDNDFVEGGPLTPDGRPDPSLDKACWNLRDYQDITLDRDGRVLVSYADGCTSAACRGSRGGPKDSTDSLATISRQTSGRTLLSAFDR